MKMVENKDHIMIFDDVLSKKNCEIIIKLFDVCESNGNVTTGQKYDRGIGSLSRNDFYIGTWEFPMVRALINEKVYECFNHYKKEFFQIESANIDFDEVKIQRTPIRGGFHDWHCEIGDIKTIERCLVWMIYLNDIPENEGETEFLWQKLRVQPKQGRLVMWPAFFTHVHRGNPVYSCSKYVATGWGNYNDPDFEKYYFTDDAGFHHKILDTDKYS